MKKVTIVLIVLAGIALMTAACGMHEAGDHEQRMNYVLWRASGALDLSDEQKQEAKAVFAEVADTMKAHRSECAQAHQQVADMVRFNQINEESVNALIDERLLKFEEIRPLMVEKIVDLYAILDGDQRQKLADLMEKRFSSSR